MQVVLPNISDWKVLVECRFLALDGWRKECSLDKNRYHLHILTFIGEASMWLVTPTVFALQTECSGLM